ncbi:hypothetical protein A3J98_02090 [candidate division WS6 bacterium RIFOXYC1_FULL_33_10]|uniref:Uncharacterized protein n=1 Tax=candidate division WS6 bacterium RIFOXYC1_FULL_33_10 TaxID=1802606 RepID=A0A1F4UGY0_9BACT|nr:MAG: hypothetical protein A3J98_02090 [candidate division WS6 bacterium RIFOXYC1_FULL_33_10]
MKSRWYANWLIVITVCLFLSSLGLFVLSLKSTVGFTKCAYGDDLGDNCICSLDGKKICDEKVNVDESLESSEFTSDNLKYTYDFTDFIDAGNRVTSNVIFSDISYMGGGLSVTLQIRAFCNDDENVAQQIGFYKLDKERLVLTVSSNIVNDSFSLPCTTRSEFYIGNFPKEVVEEFEVFYQDEFKVLYPANSCVYEGFVRNEGDVYNSNNGCFLCQCEGGENICEQETGCLQ